MRKKRAIDIVGLREMTQEDVINHMVEVELIGKDKSEIFRRVRETLERIGLTSAQEENTLYQSCHILHKKGRYYIAHFKMLFVHEGRENRLAHSDIARQNRVIKILENWGMIKVLDQTQLEGCDNYPSGVKILRHEERPNWTLKAKYKVGNNTTVHERVTAEAA